MIFPGTPPDFPGKIEFSREIQDPGKSIELLRKNRIGEEKAVYLAHELLFLLSVVGQSEQLKAVEKLKDFAYEVCPLHREDDLEEIVGSL